MKAKKRSLLINLGPLKKGGGQNVALNFVQALQRKSPLNLELYFVVCESSLLVEALKNSKWSERLLIVSSNPIKRIIQELTLVRRFIEVNRIELVYTYFGFGLFGRRIRQVIGSADSNLYFPEVDFWQSERPLEKVKRFLVDRFRIYGLKLASGVIFENKAMYERAERLFKIKSKVLIFPSIDGPGIQRQLDIELGRGSIKILLLCGWQRNKNILIIPELANRLKRLGVIVEFVITVTRDNSSCSKEFFQLVDEWNAHDLVSCIGPVTKAQLLSLYDKIDLVMLLSLLESFSNNIIEAWHFKRPLIISDELWSRGICEDAAMYVPRSDVEFISQSILELSKNKGVSEMLIKRGSEALSRFPNIDERLEQELDYIEGFYD